MTVSNDATNISNMKFIIHMFLFLFSIIYHGDAEEDEILLSSFYARSVVRVKSKIR